MYVNRQTLDSPLIAAIRGATKCRPQEYPEGTRNVYAMYHTESLLHRTDSRYKASRLIILVIHSHTDGS